MGAGRDGVIGLSGRAKATKVGSVEGIGARVKASKVRPVYPKWVLALFALGLSVAGLGMFGLIAEPLYPSFEVSVGLLGAVGVGLFCVYGAVTVAKRKVK